MSRFSIILGFVSYRHIFCALLKTGQGPFGTFSIVMAASRHHKWAKSVQVAKGTEIRCILCNRVFMKAGRKRIYGAAAYRRHEATEQHIKAAAAATPES